MATALNHRLREGIAAAQAKEFDRARGLLEQVAKESPSEILAWFWLAVASPSADAAVPCLRRVLAIDPSHAKAREGLAKLLVAQAATVASSHERAQARALVTEASQLTPDAQSVWLALATLCDDYASRIDALRRAMDLNPDTPHLRTRLRQGLLNRAMMLARADRAGACAMLREVAELDSSDRRVWLAIAQLADRPDEVVEALRELLRLAPDHAVGRTLLKNALSSDARALAASGSTADAAARWREVVALDGADVAAWLDLADVTPDDEEAEKAVDAAFKINPTDERVTAAMTRFAPLDPRAFEAPSDAFARLESPADAFARLEPDDHGGAQAELSADAFDEFATALTPAIEPTILPAPHSSAGIEPTPLAAPPIESAPVAAPPIEPAPQAPVVGAHQSGSGRRTIMVVDDSPTIRKILGLTLERAGYKVVAEPDGESAVERLHHIVPDLILLDIAMPKLDGYEVCKRIKKDARTAHVPVVMLSGKDAFFDKVKGHMAGATEYLTKPFETPAVLAVVETHCKLAEEIAHG